MQNFNSFIERKMIREMSAGLLNEEVADLDTPDREAYRKAKASFMIATTNETVAKRRCLSFAKASLSVSSVSDSIPSEVTRLCTKKINGSSTSNDSDLEGKDSKFAIFRTNCVDPDIRIHWSNCADLQYLCIYVV